MMSMIYSGIYFLIINIIYIVKLLDSKPSDNECLFGVSCRKEWMNEPELHAIRRDYIRQLTGIFLILLVFFALSFLAEYDSIRTGYGVVVMVMGILFLHVPYVLANKRLSVWKHCWIYDYLKKEGKVHGELETVDIKEVRAVRTLPFMIPVILSIGPAVWGVYTIFGGSEHTGPLLLQASFITLTVSITAHWFDHLKVEYISTEREINIAYTHKKRVLWKRFWLLLAWTHTFYIFLITFTMIFIERPGLIQIVSTFLYAILIVRMVAVIIKKRVRLHVEYEKERNIMLSQDTDRQWLWGIFYWNPQDPSPFAPSLFRGALPFNVARLLGKGVCFFIGTVAVMFLVLCSSIITQEFTPIRLEISGDELIGTHIIPNFRVKISEIEELVEKRTLPKYTPISEVKLANLQKGIYKQDPMEALPTEQKGSSSEGKQSEVTSTEEKGSSSEGKQREVTSTEEKGSSSEGKQREVTSTGPKGSFSDKEQSAGKGSTEMGDAHRVDENGGSETKNQPVSNKKDSDYCLLFVNPNHNVYISFLYHGNRYYMSDDDPNKTGDLLKVLKGILEQADKSQPSQGKQPDS